MLGSLHRNWATSLLIVGTLSQTLNECSGYVETSTQNLKSGSAIATTSTKVQIDSATYRKLTETFAPATTPGYSYPASQAPTPAEVLEPMVKGDRMISRWKYNVDTGLTLVLLVEDDRVIGYQINLGGGV